MTTSGRASSSKRSTSCGLTRSYCSMRGMKMSLTPRWRNFSVTNEPRNPAPPVSVTRRVAQKFESVIVLISLLWFKEYFQAADNQARGMRIFHDGQPLFQTGEPANFSHVAAAFQLNRPVTLSPYIFNHVQHPFANKPVEVERILNIVDRQPGTQRQTVGGDDITQLTALGAPHFDVSFRNQAFKMPVDCPDSYSKLRRQ